MDTSATQSNVKLNANEAPARVANLALGRLEKLAPRPNTLADTGLSEAFLGDLVVKHLFDGGVLTMATLTERLALSGPILEEIINFLRKEARVEIRGAMADGSASNLRYALTERGRATAQGCTAAQRLHRACAGAAGRLCAGSPGADCARPHGNRRGHAESVRRRRDA